MKTGVIGLGAMGIHMARNLRKGRHLECIWNRTIERAQRLAEELDIACAQNPADLARRSEVILTCVSADEDLLAVLDLMLPGLDSEKVVVDTSTVSDATAREAARRLSEVGASFLDAPVSGGVEGARKGTLAMMVGGDSKVLKRIRPILTTLSAHIVHMGPVGAGQATKAVNQVMAAGINQAVSEALVFGQALGLPMEKLIEATGSGAAGSWFLSHRGPTMIQGQFEPGFKVALHQKDLRICQGMAERLGGRLPLMERTLGEYQQLVEKGLGDQDISALFRLKQALFEEDR